MSTRARIHSLMVSQEVPVVANLAHIFSPSKATVPLLLQAIASAVFIKTLSVHASDNVVEEQREEVRKQGLAASDECLEVLTSNGNRDSIRLITDFMLLAANADKAEQSNVQLDVAAYADQSSSRTCPVATQTHLRKVPSRLLSQASLICPNACETIPDARYRVQST